MNCPEIIQCFFRVLPYVNELLVGDAGVTLTDTEKYLLAKPGKKLDLKINPGDPLKPGSAVYRAINEKKRIIIRADKSFFGTPYIAVAIPLFDRGSGAGNTQTGNNQCGIYKKNRESHQGDTAKQ